MSEVIIRDCHIKMITKVNDSIMSFIITSLQEKYPECIYWFKNKVIPELCTENRNLFLLYNKNKLIGFSITKTKNETYVKICSLYIISQYRNLGIGTFLLRHIIRYYDKKYFYMSFRCLYNEMTFINHFITKLNFKLIKIKLISVNRNEFVDIFYRSNQRA